MKVLDLFAGRNVLWNNIPTQYYFGVDTEKGTGKNFDSFYNKAPSLFNARAIDFFYEMLANYGIREVNYYEIRDHFKKHYGYFKVNR